MKASRYFFNGLIIFFFALVLVSVVSKIYGSLFSKQEIPSTVSAPPPVKQLNLHCSFDEGWLSSHDLYLSNTTGDDLTEVRVAIRFIGENASPVVNRYWAKWPLGEKQHIAIPVADVQNIQRIVATGMANQGEFNQAWVKK